MFQNNPYNLTLSDCASCFFYWNTTHICLLRSPRLTSLPFCCLLRTRQHNFWPFLADFCLHLSNTGAIHNFHYFIYCRLLVWLTTESSSFSCLVKLPEFLVAFLFSHRMSHGSEVWCCHWKWKLHHCLCLFTTYIICMQQAGKSAIYLLA